MECVKNLRYIDFMQMLGEDFYKYSKYIYAYLPFSQIINQSDRLTVDLCDQSYCQIVSQSLTDPVSYSINLTQQYDQR